MICDNENCPQCGKIVRPQKMAELREENERLKSWRNGTLAERQAALDLADELRNKINNSKELISSIIEKCLETRLTLFCEFGDYPCTQDMDEVLELLYKLEKELE